MNKKAGGSNIGCFAKILVVLLVAIGVWVGVKYFRGEIKKDDLTTTEGLTSLTKQLASDTTEAAKKGYEVAEPLAQQAYEAAKASLAQLEKRIKGAPPTTQEQVKAEIEEARQELAAAPQTPEPPKSEAITPPPSTAFSRAMEEFRKGCAYYAETDPVKNKDYEIQKNIRLAAPHFQQCLDYCDQARRENGPTSRIDNLEQSAAKKLYDCRKRMELKMR